MVSASVLLLLIDPGIAGLMTAFAGVVTAVGALFVNARSKREQKQEEAAAAKIREDQAALAEIQATVDSVKGLNATLHAEIDRERRFRLEAEAAIDEERMLRRRMFSEQEARCRETATDLQDGLMTLRTVVLDEAARVATDMLLRDTPPHPHGFDRRLHDEGGDEHGRDRRRGSD